MTSHQELLDQIALWHSAQEHGRIQSAILGLAVSERSDELLSLLARALINEDEFTAALEILEGMDARCGAEPWYCLRRALALWQLHREDEALPWFSKAQSLGLEEIDELPGSYFPKLVSKWLERAETWAPRRVELKAFEARRRAARSKQPLAADFTAADLEGLWDDCDYSRDKYTGKAPTADEMAAVEVELGYRLPAAYKALVAQHNGGLLMRNACPNSLIRDWTAAAYSVESIYGMDRSKEYSLCGSMGSRFWMDEWHYPAIGVVVGDTISAGHQMIVLDYSDCGPQGEPCVVSIDQESNFEISYLADNFAQFIRSLIPVEDD